MMISSPSPGVRERSAEWIEAHAAVAEHQVGMCIHTATSASLARSDPPYDRFQLYGGDYGLDDLPGVIEQLILLADEMRKRRAT